KDVVTTIIGGRACRTLSSCIRLRPAPRLCPVAVGPDPHRRSVGSGYERRFARPDARAILDLQRTAAPLCILCPHISHITHNAPTDSPRQPTCRRRRLTRRGARLFHGSGKAHAPKTYGFCAATRHSVRGARADAFGRSDRARNDIVP